VLTDTMAKRKCHLRYSAATQESVSPWTGYSSGVKWLLVVRTEYHLHTNFPFPPNMKVITKLNGFPLFVL